MQKIATIYRFNTPFLDFKKEKDGLIGIQNKISDFVSNFEGIELGYKKEDLGEYMRLKYKTKNNLIKLNFYYLKVYNGNYYTPIFKLDIFVDRLILSEKIIVGFLINIFECFDGLDEREYLVDLDNSLYYKKLFRKIYPTHDFIDLDNIKTEFEENKGNEVLENFIETFSKKNYKLTVENSEEYHKIHSIVLYYIYLVYLLYQNIVDSKNQLDYLEEIDLGDENHHKDLIQERLKFVNDMSIDNFKRYYQRLEIFFNLFK